MFTAEGFQKSKIVLSRCMRSKKKTFPAQHGEQDFAVDDTPSVKRIVQKRLFHHRGVSKMRNLSVAQHEEEKKKTVPMQHGHHIPRFCNTPKRFVEATLEGQFCRRRVARNLVQVCAAAPAARRTLFATLMRWMPLSAQTCSKS